MCCRTMLCYHTLTRYLNILCWESLSNSKTNNKEKTSCIPIWMRKFLTFWSFQWCVLFVPCVPLHVTFVIVLCFLSFVLIVCMFAWLLFLLWQRGGLVNMDHPLCHTRVQSLDPKHLYILLLFTSVLAVTGIYELTLYIIFFFLFVLMF